MLFIVLYSFLRTFHLASKMNQETEPSSPQNITTSLRHGNNDNDSNYNNERNHNEEISEIIMSSQTASTSNGTPYSLSNIFCEIVRGPSSPMTKIKWACDAWNMIKRIKNNPEISTKHEEMIHLCLNYGQILKCAKYKRTDVWLTTRALDHNKKCEKRHEHYSNAADKWIMTIEAKRVKSESNLRYAGEGFFSKIFSRQKMITSQARCAQLLFPDNVFIFCLLTISSMFLCLTIACYASSRKITSK